MNKDDERLSYFKTTKLFCKDLINWLGEEHDDLYDAVPAKDIVPSEGSDVLEICGVLYQSRLKLLKLVRVILSGAEL